MLLIKKLSQKVRKDRYKIMPANDNDFGKIQKILDYLMFELPEGTAEH
jgi:hypothetical protein